MAMLLDTNMYVITCNMLMLFYQITILCIIIYVNHVHIIISCLYNICLSVCLSVCLTVQRMVCKFLYGCNMWLKPWVSVTVMATSLTVIHVVLILNDTQHQVHRKLGAHLVTTGNAGPMPCQHPRKRASIVTTLAALSLSLIVIHVKSHSQWHLTLCCFIAGPTL